MTDRKPMKFAPVAPYHIYQQFAVNGYSPNTVLLLAHDVVNHKEEYSETFDHPNWNDTTIIMDNSLVETGGAVDANMVHAAANIVNADIVVLPDVMGDGILSAEATIIAWNHWAWKFRNYQKMVVLHGKDDPEWFTSAELIKATGIKPDWLSIPRITENGTGRRMRLVHFAQMIFGSVPHHLLGFSDYIASDLFAASHPLVQSIDSAVPLRQHSLNLISEDPGKRDPQWFEDVVFHPYMILRCQNVDTYINNLG